MPILFRNTRQKEAIRSAFFDADRPLSPDEALQHAQGRVPGMSVATVYRNIHALLEDKWLVPVEIPGQGTRYEVAGKEHHHHFQCTSCGKTFELAGCGLGWRPELPSGFQATGHEIFLYGSCDRCPAAAAL